MKNQLINSFEKIKWKTRLGVFTIATLLWLSWCWGWWTDDSNSKWIEVYKVKVQAWTVVWANVEIKTLSWVSLVNYKTDDYWNIYIDKEQIKLKLSELWLSYNEPLEFISSWWVDIDPDDDWNFYNDVDENLTWKMSWVASLEEIKNWYINPLSSLVNDILKEQTWNYSSILNTSWDVNQFNYKNEIDTILTWVWAIDSNNDWITDLKDIISYDMVSDKSPLETSIINNWYLDYLHGWNTDFQNQFVTNPWTITSRIDIETWWPIDWDPIIIPDLPWGPEELENNTTTTLSWEEVNNYYVWNSYEKVKNDFLNLTNSSKYYVLWLWDWSFQATKDSIEMIKSIPEETINWLISYWSLLIESIAFWEAKAMHWLTWNQAYADIRDSINDDILSQSIETQQEIEIFYNEILNLKQEISNAITNLESLEQPEYWGWYLNWYLDVLVAEWVTMTVATKNAAKVISILKKSKWYLVIQKITARINLSWEIYKTTFKTIDLNKLARSFDEFWQIYWIETEQIMKRSFILAVDKGINEKTLMHLIYWEWLESWSLKSGLHSMNAVEMLLRDWKIDIKYLSWKNTLPNWDIENVFTPVSYEEYLNLSDELKQTVKIAPKWTNNFSKTKTLFPKIWTDEDIAEAIKIAEENIKDILINDYNLPLYSRENAWKYWKIVKWKEIKYKIKLENWKEIELELWWKYDNNWNLDFAIRTLYPTY